MRFVVVALRKRLQLRLRQASVTSPKSSVNKHPAFPSIVAIPTSQQHPSILRVSSNALTRNRLLKPPAYLHRVEYSTDCTNWNFIWHKRRVYYTTMPKVKQSTLAGLVDSDSDDGFAMPTPDSAVENKAVGRKARGRPKTAPSKPAPSKVTKTKAKVPTRRTSGRLVAKAMAVDGAPAETKRPALKDRTNQVYDEEMDDFDQDLVMEGTFEEPIVAVKKTKPKVTKKTATTKREATRNVSHTSTIYQSTVENSKPEARATKKRGPAKKQKPVEPLPEKIVQETQHEDMDIDMGVDEEVEEPSPEPILKPTHSIARTQSHPRQRQPSVPRRRAGSASDTERNDPALRRKLGELTKKYETLNLKYQDLREIGLKEAERNFERLRKETESKTKSKPQSSTNCNIINPK